MTEFEILDTNEVIFQKPPSSPQRAVKAPVVRSNPHDIKPPSKRSVSLSEDYRPTASNSARVYEVVIETVDYNKTGAKINYSHTIKYPGHEDFFK